MMSRIESVYDLLKAMWTLDSAATENPQWYIRTMTPGMIRVLVEGMETRNDPELWTVFQCLTPSMATRVLSQRQRWSPRLLTYLQEAIERN